MKRSVFCDRRARSCLRDRGAKRFFFGSSSRRKEQTNRRASEQTRARTRARTHARTHARTYAHKKLTQNRPKSFWGHSGRPKAIRRASGALPGRSGRRSESSRDAPGAPRDAPGARPDAPERPKSAPGRHQIDFCERAFRTTARETLPERFPDDLWVRRGGRNTQSDRHGAYGLHVGRFSSERLVDHEIARKTVRK